MFACHGVNAVAPVAPDPTIENGVVNVVGTSKADHITISLNSDGIGIDVDVNGSVSTFFRSMVTSFVVNGGKGNDVITVNETNGSVNYAMRFNGGGGKDVLTGGSGNDVLVGGHGKDVLNGGGGANMLYQNSVIA
jgi:Ca2+-binding RTX toxin-like protein